MSTGVYDIQNLDFELRGVYTHTTPLDAYRGAGRPEAAFLIERLMDAAAREMGMPVADLRRSNFIKPEQMPYRTPGGRTYDVGEFDGHMTRALEKAGAGEFPRTGRRGQGPRQAARFRHRGLHRGLRLCRLRAGQADARRRWRHHALHRHPDQRAGPCHRLQPVCGRQDRHRFRQDHRASGRYRGACQRWRHRWLALDPAGRRLGGPRLRGAGRKDEEAGRR
jgi:hypothetical protein